MTQESVFSAPARFMSSEAGGLHQSDGVLLLKVDSVVGVREAFVNMGNFLQMDPPHPCKFIWIGEQQTESGFAFVSRKDS